MVICLGRDADLHIAQLMPLPFTLSCFSKIQIGLPFWYRLARVVPDKEPLNGCVCVCVYVHCDPKMPPYYFLNNSVESELILRIFGTQNQRNFTTPAMAYEF